ncbi:MAG: hypothetical protein ACYTFQ_32765 [Planctomycetota bacterium]
MQWGSDDEPLSEGVGVILAGHVYCLSFYRATSIPANFYDAAGYCNSAAVACYSLGKTYAAQTLLHADPRAERHAIGLNAMPFWAGPTGGSSTTGGYTVVQTPRPGITSGGRTVAGSGIRLKTPTATRPFSPQR